MGKEKTNICTSPINLRGDLFSVPTLILPHNPTRFPLQPSFQNNPKKISIKNNNLY